MGTVVNVYDLSFNRIGIIDSFVSLIWRPAFYDIGDFELYMGASIEALNLLKQNRLLVRDKDITVDNSGNVTYSNVMMINNINLVTDVENGDFLSITGKELKFLLHRRIAWGQQQLGPVWASSCMQSLLYTEVIEPTNTNRVIPNFNIGEIARGDIITKQVTGDNVDNAIRDMAMTGNLGWTIKGYNHSYLFETYEGVNRSYDQSERPYVVFSDKFENLYNTEYQLNTEDYANTALVGGEGEGDARRYTNVNNYSGLNRYELFVDARDISSNDGAIPSSTYINMLKQRGREKVYDASYTEGFSGEILTVGNYTYGKDFYLGDTVTVINSYGIQKNVKVLSAIESEDENGINVIPQFNF